MPDISHREALAELGKLLERIGRGRTIVIRVRMPKTVMTHEKGVRSGAPLAGDN